MDLETTRLLT